MSATNPCQSCGACCAHFRVSFYWSEAEPSLGGTVRPEMTRKLDNFRACMAGTDQKQPRCTALAGEIGKAVNCTIYENRPSPCREFAVDWVDGLLVFSPEDLDRCTRARAAYGLPPLLEALAQRPAEPVNPVDPEHPDLPQPQAS